jgi:hypothetical protein
VSVVFGATPLPDAAALALDLKFEHIDVAGIRDLDEQLLAELPLPIGDRLSGPRPMVDATCQAPRDDSPAAFDDAVVRFRALPGVRIEPTPGSVLGSIERARAFAEAVPGIRYTVDTGHVATWGEDPVELLGLADHVQLRQARAGTPQVHADDRGDVDFGAVVGELERIRYRGRLSIEYFDLPARGYPLDDPIGHAVALAAQIRSLMS